MSRNFLVRAFRNTATAPSSSDKPQYGDMSCHIRGRGASSSLVSPLPYLPPLSSMPVPFNIPLPIPTGESGSKQEVLVPVEYQHRLSKRKAMRGPDCCKMLHLNGGENSIGNSTGTLYIEADVQNGGDPVVLIDDDESARARPSESKRLKELFTKTMKNSDVGCPGRIIVPKRKAEKHLPKLGEKTSIELVIRDILGSTSSWIVKYRSWSNSRSMMYIFEHTGDFVRENGIRAGDSITVYEDDCKNYYFSIKKLDEETRGTTGLAAVAPTNGLGNMEVPFVENYMVPKGGEFEGIDPNQEDSLELRVQRARIKLSSWTSMGKLWEETCCRESGFLNNKEG